MSCWGSLVGSPQSQVHQDKEQTPAQKERASSRSWSQGALGCMTNPAPPPPPRPRFRETQKIGHLFIFKFCIYFSILQVHIQYKEDHRGWREQKSIRQARCTEGTLELVGGSMGLPKAPSVCYWEGGGSGGQGTTHVSPDPQTTKTASKKGAYKTARFYIDLRIAT